MRRDKRIRRILFAANSPAHRANNITGLVIDHDSRAVNEGFARKTGALYGSFKHGCDTPLGMDMSGCSGAIETVGPRTSSRRPRSWVTTHARDSGAAMRLMAGAFMCVPLHDI